MWLSTCNVSEASLGSTTSVGLFVVVLLLDCSLMVSYMGWDWKELADCAVCMGDMATQGLAFHASNDELE